MVKSKSELSFDDVIQHQSAVDVWRPQQTVKASASQMVQMRQASGLTGAHIIQMLEESKTGSVHQAAAEGLKGSAGSLPHLDTIQKSFGQHDVTGIQSYVGGPAKEANEQMGSMAYATNNSVAFKKSPDLHTAAHEAAHIVQQRAGVSLAGGVGSVGDVYEQHADAVADRVVSGGSAEGLLSDGPRGSGGGGVVQRKVHIEAEGGNGHYNSEERLNEIMEMVNDPECKEFLDQLPPGKTVDDPRVRTLAMAREKYAFATWQALQQAIDTHWGKGLPTDKVPSSFILGGDWAKAPPLPTRNLAGMNTELASLLPTDALPQGPLNNTGGWPLTEAATKENAESQETEFRKAYNACGFTAQNIIATVQAKGGEMQLVHEHQFEGMDAATDFETLMMATVSKTTFFDVVIRQVHEFTIEKHADGKQVLHQGYLSGYNALWWSGHDDNLIEEAVAAHPEVAQARELMGKGKPFDRATLRDEIVAKMGDFLRTDVYGDPGSTAAWENLPFHPGDTGPGKYQKNDKARNNKIKILVKVYQPQNEAAVLEALNGNDGDFLSSLVMDEVAEKWDEIKAAKNAE